MDIMTNKSNARVEYIDVAKGISILLVAVHHSALRKFFPEIIDSMSLFRMPLFFFLSGIFFTWLATPRVFLWKKFDALLKPYFTVTLALLFLEVIYFGGNFEKQLIGLLYGNGKWLDWTPLWFLTHLFALYCFSYFLYKYANFKNVPALLKIVILILFLLAGATFIRLFWKIPVTVVDFRFYIYGLPYSIDILLITSVFFISGQLLGKRLLKFHHSIFVFCFALILFLSISIFSDAYIGLNRRVYREPFLATLGAISGIYIILSLSWYLSKYTRLRKILLLMGEGSLFILVFHYPIQKKVYQSLASGFSDDGIKILIAIFSVFLAIFSSLLIKWLVERNDFLALGFLPFESNKTLKKYLKRI